MSERYRLLQIDDEPWEREILQHFLKDAAQIDHAIDFAAAREAMSQVRYDLVLVDFFCDLPGRDSFLQDMGEARLAMFSKSDPQWLRSMLPEESRHLPMIEKQSGGAEREAISKWVRFYREKEKGSP